MGAYTGAISALVTGLSGDQRFVGGEVARFENLLKHAGSKWGRKEEEAVSTAADHCGRRYLTTGISSRSHRYIMTSGPMMTAAVAC